MADIHIRLPNNQQAVIEAAAKSAGLSVSAYVRKQLIDGTPEILPVVAEEKAGEKTQTVSIRLTAGQLKDLEEKAKMAGVNKSEYIRHCLTGQKIVVMLEGKEILRQLTGIGNNLNQLTMLAHQGRITAVHLDEVERIQKKIIKELRNIMKRG